ncbi:MAG: PilN domain-containing protein [Syntrophorhabdaceae bacterium]|nr:PilN domain-containing protein [Syntrophorhabdaceae bacterium]
MIRINLIRGKRKKRREINIGGAFLIVPLAVIAGVLYWHFGVVIPKLDATKANVDQATAQVARIQKDIEELEKFKNRKAELQRKVDIINNLQRERVGPVRYFEALSSAIPEKCWIDKLEIRGSSLAVSGVALNNNTVANFMTALAGTGRFRDIILGSADQASLQNTKLVRFNLTFIAVD